MSRTQRLTASIAVGVGLLAILAMPGAAAAKDRNHDGIPDRWEKRHHLSLHVNQAHRDQDGDHLRNRAEFLAGDNPRSADSDGDGIPDGEENAGKIASFDPTSGKLVIDLFDGETLSGQVSEETAIKCEHSDSASASDSNQGEDNSGDEQDSEGEDQQGQSEEEPGEDNDDNTGDEDENGEAACTTADLVPGAVVQQAELRAANGAATFEEIELG